MSRSILRAWREAGDAGETEATALPTPDYNGRLNIELELKLIRQIYYNIKGTCGT